MNETECDDLGRPLSAGQRDYFANSKIRDENGRLLTMYHGSSYAFDTFDVQKIRADETDAMYNGFWFSSDPYTLPAWTRLHTRYEVYVNISNPAPLDVIRETIREVKSHWFQPNAEFHPDSRSIQDEVRYRLQDLGYDGIIHDWKPQVDVTELEEKGRTVVTSARGRKYVLQQDEIYGGLDLYTYAEDAPNHCDEHLTGYADLADYMSIQERTVVCFRPEQIKAVTNRSPTKAPNFQANSLRKEISDNMNDAKGYILTDSHGDDIQVFPQIDIYRSTNGLCIGLQSYDPDLEGLDNYCSLTINGDMSLPYLEAAIDTTYNGQEKTSFLIRNGFAEPTGRELPYGGAWYPIFRFHEEKLQEIDGATFQTYASLHGMEKSGLDSRISDAKARAGKQHGETLTPGKEHDR